MLQTTSTVFIVYIKKYFRFQISQTILFDVYNIRHLRHFDRFSPKHDLHQTIL
jgi:hypothetical protein